MKKILLTGMSGTGKSTVLEARKTKENLTVDLDYDNWIYFDETRNKLAVNNWHLSVRSSSESIYNEMITAYKNFLIQYPDFTNSHRK